jgi:hypothetical protein
VEGEDMGSWWRDPRIRALGVVVAVGGLAAWMDRESLRGVQTGLEMRRMREEQLKRRMEAENLFIEVWDYTHLPQVYPWRVDWARDIVFVEAYGRIYHSKGGRRLYEWYRRYPGWSRYVILDRFPSWRRSP